MIRWFVDTLQQWIDAALRILAALVEGLLNAPATAAVRAVSPISVRRAAAAELVDLRHQVLRQGRPRDTAVYDGDTSADTKHWVALLADRVVGVVSVFRNPMPEPPPGVAPPERQLRGMAVAPELRGEGVGVRLLLTTHAVGEPMWCNARAHAVPFYERFGWQVCSDTFDIKDVGPHQRMWWQPDGGGG